jgi:Glycosyltransferase
LAKLVLVGDGPLRAELSAQIEDLQLVKNVFLLGNRRDVPELLHVFDVFVLPSLREGLPIVLLEAMAAGIPVIASDVDGNTELVIENKTGLIVPPHDIFALAGAIVRMLRDKQSAKLMSSAAKEMVIKDFSFETMVKKYETLYWNNAKA